jgi:hypothetical protein
MKPRDWRSSGYDWLFILRYGLFGRLEEVDVEMLRVGIAGEMLPDLERQDVIGWSPRFFSIGVRLSCEFTRLQDLEEMFQWCIFYHIDQSY